MSLTKAQVRTLIRAQIPDPLKQAWHDSTLDVLVQSVMDEIWAEVIDEVPWAASVTEIVPASTLVDGLSLTLGSLTKRFYRVQTVMVNDQQYGPAHQNDDNVYTGGLNQTFTKFTYAIRGGSMFLFPAPASSDVIVVRYSFLLPAFTTLADTDSTWVDGFENAYINEVLSRILADPNQVAKFHAISLSTTDRLKSRLRRQFVGPAVEQSPQDLLEWGSV